MTTAVNDNAIIVSLNTASLMSSLSRTAINRLGSAGEFPAEVKLGERRIGFVRAEVVAWIDYRVNARAA